MLALPFGRPEVFDHFEFHGAHQIILYRMVDDERMSALPKRTEDILYDLLGNVIVPYLIEANNI